MQKLINWLIRANARMVLICWIVALIGVSAWWVWTILQPLEHSASLLGGSSRRDDKTTLGLLTMLTRESRAVAVPGSPFRSLRSDRPMTYWKPRPRLSNVTVHRRRSNSSNGGTTMVIKPHGAPSPSTEPATSPKPSTVSVKVSYHGIMKIDGKDLALIEDSEGGRRFYKRGDDMHGMTISHILSQHIELTTDSGERQSVHISKPHVFQVPADAN